MARQCAVDISVCPLHRYTRNKECLFYSNTPCSYLRLNLYSEKLRSHHAGPHTRRIVGDAIWNVRLDSPTEACRISKAVCGCRRSWQKASIILKRAQNSKGSGRMLRNLKRNQHESGFCWTDFLRVDNFLKIAAPCTCGWGLARVLCCLQTIEIKSKLHSQTLKSENKVVRSESQNWHGKHLNLRFNLYESVHCQTAARVCVFIFIHPLSAQSVFCFLKRV